MGSSQGSLPPVFGAYEKIAEEPGDRTYVLVFPDDGFKYVELFESYLGMT
ncbi:cysteine synthase [Thermococcus sp. 4557]